MPPSILFFPFTAPGGWRDPSFKMPTILYKFSWVLWSVLCLAVLSLVEGSTLRKGLWLPLPSSEVGLGAVHLMDSQMWAAQGYVKFALLEGYHKLPLPSIAVRVAASRVFGSRDLDLTVASADVSISKHVLMELTCLLTF